MDFSPQQEQALASTAEWLHLGDFQSKPFFLINGYAGTGKTTITRHLIEGVSGTVLSGAYTGKAALVMQRAGMPNAQTIHSMIYKFQPPNKQEYLDLKEEMAEAERAGASATELKRLKLQLRDIQQPSFVLNDDEDAPIRNASLVVLDECSMIDEDMATDLLSFRVPILVLGDPGQLPPIAGEGFFTRNEPDILLTEIHRQARDNPIIRLATLARQGKRLNLGLYGDSKIVSKRSVSKDEVLGADQLLCGKNATRLTMNQRTREILGYTSPYPQRGEKLICLKNDKDKGIYNGQLFTVASDPSLGVDSVDMELEAEGGRKVEVRAHQAFFDVYRNSQAIKELSWWDFVDRQQFDFGYAITVHKSQGSQWDSICLMDDRFGTWDRANNYALRHQWLYTALTRAIKRVTVGV